VQFGISTFLYHGQRLSRAHLEEIAAHGFDAIELFALRPHFDYADPAAVASLAEWLQATGLALHSVHAPINEYYAAGAWGRPLSIADRDGRSAAVREAVAAMQIARTVPFPYLVVHVGTPDAYVSSAQDNSRDQARRAVEDLHAAAAPLGIRLALEVIANALSSVDSLVRLVDDDLELPDAGLCLDFGHAFLMGDVVDAVEAASGHLFTTHLHDNDGREDTHLVPFEGQIDWPRALFAMQKIGYEDRVLFELKGNPAEVLPKARRASLRFQEILAS
jgi:sugar phosphate isomerase/epimerase